MESWVPGGCAARESPPSPLSRGRRERRSHNAQPVPVGHKNAREGRDEPPHLDPIRLLKRPQVSLQSSRREITRPVLRNGQNPGLGKRTPAGRSQGPPFLVRLAPPPPLGLSFLPVPAARGFLPAQGDGRVGPAGPARRGAHLRPRLGSPASQPSREAHSARVRGREPGPLPRGARSARTAGPWARPGRLLRPSRGPHGAASA